MRFVRPRPVRWLREHPRQADWLLAIALTTAAVLFHVFGTEQTSPSDERSATWWSVPLSAATVLPIAYRRVRPEAVAIVVTAAQLLFTLLDFDGGTFLGVMVALYSLGAHSTGPGRTRVVTGIAVAIGLLFVAGLLFDELVVTDFISSTVVLVTAFVLGDNLRRRRDAAAAMIERAERAERERDLLAHQRVAAERARIARELHDVVAHSVSSMVIQAAAARRSLDRSPEDAAEALENIETVGRRAMGELRSTLGVLRASSELPDGATTTDPAATAPQPTLADLASLIAEATDLPVAAEIDDGLADVPSAVGLVGFRLVQEALTNVRRHAGGVTRVDVTVRMLDDVVHVEVLDDGRGLAADDDGRIGYGLLGMRERVTAIGGEVTAGHRIGGGWRVAARLPVERPRRPTVMVARPTPERSGDRQIGAPS